MSIRMKHLVSAFICLAFVFLAFGSVDTDEATTEQEVTESVSSDAVVEVTARQLFSDYEGNEIAADNQYKGKVLQVSGTVSDIGKDLMDTMYVTLESGNPLMSVQCFFSDSHSAELASIRKGQQVEIRGKCDGKFGNVMVKGCQIAD